MQPLLLLALKLAVSSQLAASKALLPELAHFWPPLVSCSPAVCSCKHELLAVTHSIAVQQCLPCWDSLSSIAYASCTLYLRARRKRYSVASRSPFTTSSRGICNPASAKRALNASRAEVCSCKQASWTQHQHLYNSPDLIMLPYVDCAEKDCSR